MKASQQTACAQPHSSLTAQAPGAVEFYGRLPCGGHHWPLKNAASPFLTSLSVLQGWTVRDYSIRELGSEWGDHALVPLEKVHTWMLPHSGPWRPVEKHQPSWRDRTQGQVKRGVLPSPLPPPVPRRCLGLKDGARKSWSFGLDLNLKIGLSYSHQNWPEIYTIHPRCFLKSENKFSNPAVKNLSDLMDHRTRMPTLSLSPFNKIEGRIGFF